MSTFHTATAPALPEGGDICLYGVIGDSWDGCDLKSFAEALYALGDKEEIRVKIHSVGGSVTDGLGIYNLLKSHPAKIVTEVVGIAFSMASIIALAGDEVIIPENAWYMIHNPSAWSGGTAEDLRKDAAILDGLKGSMVAIYAAKSGKSPEDISALMDAETWMNGAEALAAGFATSTGPALEALALAGVSDYMRHFSKPPQALAQAVAMAALPAAASPAEPLKPTSQKEPAMPDKTAHATQQATSQQAHAQQATGQQAPAISPQALEAARALVGEITAACATAKLTPAQTQDIVGRASTMDAAREMIIAAWAANDSPPQRSGVSVGQSYDDPSAVRAACATALAGQMAPGKIKIGKDDHARKYAGYSPLSIAAELASAKGDPPERWGRSDMVRVAMHTTSDFPAVLGTAVNLALEAEYQAEQTIYPLIAAQRDFVDFRPHNFIRMGDFPALVEMKEGEELTAGTVGEGAETAALKSYARKLRLSRQMLINDSLGAFAQIPGMIGRAAARLENKLVLGLIIANTAKLSDGKVIFHADHANLAGAATDLDVAGLSAGRAAMRKQKSKDGSALDIAPAVLLVGPDLETDAEKLTTSLTAVATGEVNPFSGRLTVAVTSLITDDTWYLLGNPSAVPGLIYGYLNGAAGPQVEVREGWDYDGAEFRAVHDFGAAVIDHRPLWRNK